MEIKEIIDPTIIKTNLDGKTKDEVLYQLANRLYEQEYITDVEAFVKDIYLREAQGQTGIGNYIAIPHGKSAYVKKVGVAIGVTENEIPWETLDGKGVKGIILFAVGDDTEGAQKHLKLLSLFARKLGNDEVVERLIAAREIDEVVAAFG
ncbi:fructose PTS transporter subunit IIA [Enterococcus spodopteracolus]|uniref:fructose PTS transporter subunit IIA n=1 Tax=Enterococcus spodopteracolus TaxID=3034501 RepID=UPI002648C758|nr:fructose PTS transporter subunit IIA [Enterococcus spodopteracolus]